jgi:hypothetical protein
MRNADLILNINIFDSLTKRQIKIEILNNPQSAIRNPHSIKLLSRMSLPANFSSKA